MDQRDWLAQRFEENRQRLRAVAYRMLGTMNDADDAVQEAWLRLNRSEAGEIENLEGWLTTVTGRVCLDMLRSRTSRYEEELDAEEPEFVLSRYDAVSPEGEALLADSLSVAVLVVLETLAPHERLAFVLHDMFAVPFEEIAAIVGCSVVAARQLASRARRRVRGAGPIPGADARRRRGVVDAFLSAVRAGDFEALVAVLDPDVVVREERIPGAPGELRGARVVAGQALQFAHLAKTAMPVLVNGEAGVVSHSPDRPLFSLMRFTVQGDRIVAIDVLRDPERLKRVDTTGLEG